VNEVNKANKGEHLSVASALTDAVSLPAERTGRRAAGASELTPKQEQKQKQKQQ
jgi:hypothetical protein